MSAKPKPTDRQYEGLPPKFMRIRVQGDLSGCLPKYALRITDADTGIALPVCDISAVRFEEELDNFVIVDLTLYVSALDLTVNAATVEKGLEEADTKTPNMCF